MTFSEGAMVETLSVGVQACKKGGVHMGTVAIIFGAGPVGLTTLLAAQAYGASQTVIVGKRKAESRYVTEHNNVTPSRNKCGHPSITPKHC